MLRSIALLLLGSVSVVEAAGVEPAPAHYVIKARVSPATGILTADVTLTLPAADIPPGTAFLLGDRFRIAHIDAGPHARIHIEPTDEPIKHLQKITAIFDQPPDKPVTLRVRYHGPLNDPDDEQKAVSSDLLELTIETMWLPFRSALNLRFTADADIRGIPADMVVVAQGTVTHTGDRVRIHRSTADNDFPMVAERGLKRDAKPDVEFFARDMDDPLISVFRKHAIAAAAFHQRAFGPLPGGPIRMVVVARAHEAGYARVGYIVMPEAREAGGKTPAFEERDPAKYVAHEFAHAWFSPADPLTEDYWLAESLAEFASMHYIEAAFSRADMLEMLERKWETAAKAGPILGKGRPSKNALYQKGPLLLFDLERRIGRPAMDRVLARLGHQPPHYTHEFLDALRAEAGDDAAKEFELKLRAE
jgi:hypothetical protein